MSAAHDLHDRCVLVAHAVSDSKLKIAHVRACGLTFRKGKSPADLRKAIAKAEEQLRYLGTRRHFISWMGHLLPRVLKLDREARTAWKMLERRCERIAQYIEMGTFRSLDLDQFGLVFAKGKSMSDIHTASKAAGAWDPHRAHRWLTLHLTQIVRIR